MAKAKVLQTIVDISGEISPTLGKTLDSVIGQLDGVNVKALAAGAAIGGIALSLGLPCGNIVLSVAVLGILITAPLGAILMDSTKKKLLSIEQ